MKKNALILLVLLSVGLVSTTYAAQDEAQKDAIRKSTKIRLAKEAQKTPSADPTAITKK
jgi:hypothetical protein